MDIYARLLADETVRGERVAWIFRWILYTLVTGLAGVVFLVQGHEVGRWGLLIGLFPLVYNAVLTPFVLRRKANRWIRYASVTVDLAALSAYNALDVVMTSPVTPMTSATLLLYPIILFLASLRLDRYLIAFATVLALAAMNGLYWWASPRFDQDLIRQVPSIDALSQVYRTIYIAVCGGLMMFIPGTIRRLLKAQHALFLEGQDHWELAHADRLTGLANRLRLEEQLPRLVDAARREDRSLALLYLDLDGFKPVNDRFGHEAGDRVLAEVGARLRREVLEGDLAVRLGGDEFVVVVTGAEAPAVCAALADRLTVAVRRPVVLEGGEVEVGVSVGAAVFPDDASDAASLLAAADRRMLSLKAGRR